MALRPEIALQAGQIQSPLRGVADAYVRGQQIADIRKQRELQEQQFQAQQRAAQQDTTLNALRNAWSGVNQLPKDQRTFDNVKKIIKSQEALTGVDIPDDQLVSDFDPETGILDDGLFQGLGASLGLVEAPEEFTLKPGEQRFRGGEVVAEVEDPRVNLQKQKQALAEKEFQLKSSGQFSGSLKDKIELEKLDLQKKKFEFDIQESKKRQEISPTVQKILVGAQDEANKQRSLTSKMDRVVDNLEKNKDKFKGGLFGFAGEKVKKVMGGQDKISSLKKEVSRLTQAEAVSLLPPGAASDRDIAIFLKGFPDDFSNVEEIQGYLRGASKVGKAQELYHYTKARLIGETGNTAGLLDEYQRVLREDFPDLYTSSGQPDESRLDQLRNKYGL